VPRDLARGKRSDVSRSWTGRSENENVIGHEMDAISTLTNNMKTSRIREEVPAEGNVFTSEVVVQYQLRSLASRAT